MMVDLTGRIGCRFSFFGKLVLQVEYRAHFYPPGSAPDIRWKDATFNELVRAMQIEQRSADFILNLTGGR